MMSRTSASSPQDRLVALDLLDDLAVLVHQLLDLQPDELDELQPPDRLGLRLREQDAALLARRVEQTLRGSAAAVRGDPGAMRKALLAQLLDRLLARLAAADQLDHFVDVAHREDQAFEDVPALLRLAEQEPRPAGDDFLAVLDEVLDQLLQPHRPRLAVHQRDVDHRHRDLARRVLVELVDDHVRVGVALQVDHDPALVLPAGVVVDVGDVLDQVVLHRTRRSTRRSTCG